ncbi:uncharacterized protein [Littorina saxatilis]|uniref:uncharacterized protein n=1 Tax=Littorina saxatilis TaxID=31220 RepID=UPI0038B587E7
MLQIKSQYIICEDRALQGTRSCVVTINGDMLKRVHTETVGCGVHAETVGCGLVLGIAVIILQVIINASPRWYTYTCTDALNSSTTHHPDIRFSTYYGIWEICSDDECWTYDSYPQRHNDTRMLQHGWLSGTRFFAVVSTVDISLLVVFAFVACFNSSCPAVTKICIGLALAFSLFQFILIACGNPSKVEQEMTGCHIHVDYCFICAFIAMLLSFVIAMCVMFSSNPRRGYTRKVPDESVNSE